MATIKQCDICKKKIETKTHLVVLDNKKFDSCESCFSRIKTFCENFKAKPTNIIGEAFKKLKELP